MITKINLKAKITNLFAAAFMAAFLLPTFAAFVPVANNGVSAQQDCKSKYIAYKQAGGANEGREYESWKSCLRGLALEWCSSADRWQAGNQSNEFKKNTCIYWYEEGFNKPRGNVCTTSNDPSGNNARTCQQAGGLSLNYNAAYEADRGGGSSGENSQDNAANNSGNSSSAQNGGDIEPAPTVQQKEIPESDDPALKCAASTQTNEDCDLIAKYVNPIIAFLSAFVGIAVTIGIISGGIRYASASDDPQKSAAGRQMIRNSLIALVAYIFLFAAIKWLVPQVMP
jgi:hypothetical protein